MRKAIAVCALIVKLTRAWSTCGGWIIVARPVERCRIASGDAADGFDHDPRGVRDSARGRG